MTKRIAISIASTAIMVAFAVSFACPVEAQTFQTIPGLSFAKAFGAANPLPQVLMVASTGAQFNFSASATTTTGGSWLTLSNAGADCCTTPEAIVVSANPQVSLAVGTYTGQIVFTNYPSATATLTVPVSLTIAPAHSAFFDDVSGQLSFSFVTGGSSPAQTIRIGNGGGGTLTWNLAGTTADGSAWLDIPVTAGTAPSLVTIGVNPQSLPGGGQTAGTFVGQLLFQAGGSSVTIPVSVTAGANVFRQANPISFTMPFAGANPLPQALMIASTGADFNFSTSVATGTGGAWLQISNAGADCCTTPFALGVSINASTLSAGTYTGEIILTEYGARSQVITVPVTLTVAKAGTAFLDNLQGQMSFFATPGGNPTAQAIQIRNGGAGTLNWSLAWTTSDNGNWLSASSVSGVAPATVTIQVAPQNLPGNGQLAGTFSGQLVVQTGEELVTVPVSVTLGANVFSQTNGINFTMPFAGADSLPQTLMIVSTGSNFNFSAFAYSATGGNWLQISNSGADCCTTPEAIRVSVDASTLSAGTYTGEIFFVEYGARTMSMAVPVTLTVAEMRSAFFDNLPGQLSFSMQTGGNTPPSQTLQVRNGGHGKLHWTLSTSTSDGSSWLKPSVLRGTAPSTVSIAILPTKLPNGGAIAGTFCGQLVFHAAGDVETVPVCAVVGADVFRQVNPLNFTMPFGGANPLSQVFEVASTGSNFNFSATAFTAKGGNWLQISNSGADCCSTPEAIGVSINASTLPAGIYTGEISLVEYGAGNMSISVPVTLTVAGSGPFFDNLPGQVSFFLSPGGSPPSQTLQVRNAGTGTLAFTAASSTSDGRPWLHVSPVSAAAPSVVTVSISTKNLQGQGLTPGTFTGQVVLTTTSDVVTIPVSVVVGNDVFEQANAIDFTMPVGANNPLPQILPIASTGANFNYSVSAFTATGGSWLQVSNSGADCCSTPEFIGVSISASTLPAGTYTGEINLVEYGARTMSMTVPVTLTVAASGAFFDNVQGLMSFFSTPGNTPLSQTVQLRNGGSGTLNWTVAASTSDGSSWLNLSAPSGTAPSTVTVEILIHKLPGKGQVPGIFTGQLIFLAPGSSVSIPVSLIVGANVFSQSGALSFSMTAGGQNPLSQSLSATSTGTNFNFSASAAAGTGGNWLQVSPSGADCCSTPKSMTVSVNGSGLPAGVYTGEINLVEYGARTMAMTVPVILTVQAAE
jgi:hypothetical protein